ncbi:hypothetical protein ACIRS3_28595 [Streptomyces virginiae]|uniref:hypothetical protein n=1 Tax=Streptomyces virginiae TaxID=1961 RepID=UPI0037F394B8
MSQTGKTQLVEVEEAPRDRRDAITGPSDVRIVNVHTAHRPSPAAAEQDATASTGRRPAVVLPLARTKNQTRTVPPNTERYEWAHLGPTISECFKVRALGKPIPSSWSELACT